MALGISIYLLYRRRLGLSPIQTHKVLLPEPLGVEEIEYKSVLVAFEDDEPFSEQTIVTAVKLAAKRRRAIHVISVVAVPSHLPLDASLGEHEEQAQSKIEQAKLIGGLRVSGHVHRVRPNQAGHSIAEEARELKASALVMGLRYRNGAPLYGKTLQTVLAERPCRVIVVGEPERARSEAGITLPVAGSPGRGVGLAALEHAALLVVRHDLVEQALLELAVVQVVLVDRVAERLLGEVALLPEPDRLAER